MGSGVSTQLARGFLSSFHMKLRLIKFHPLFEGLTNEQQLDLVSCFAVIKMGSGVSTQLARGFLSSFHMKLRLIKFHPLFEGLTNEQQLDLVSCFAVIKIRKGEIVELPFHQSYLLAEGRLKANLMSSLRKKTTKAAYNKDKEKTDGEYQARVLFSYDCLPGNMIHAVPRDCSKKENSLSDLPRITYECIENTVVFPLKEETVKELVHYHMNHNPSDEFIATVRYLVYGLYPSLNELKFMKTATPLQRKIFADHFQLETFEKGTKIFEEGEIGNEMYHILRGICSVIVDRPVDKMTDFRKKLIRQDSDPGTPAKRVTSPVKKTFKLDVSMFDDMTLRLTNVTSGKKSGSLKRLRPEVRRDPSRLSITSMKVISGTVGLLKHPGFFGLCSLMEPRYRSYTAGASSDLLLATLKAENIKDYLNFYPTVKEKLEKHMVERYIQKAKNMGVPFLSAVHDQAFDQFGNGCFVHHLYKGDIVNHHQLSERRHSLNGAELAPKDTVAKQRRSIYIVLQGEVELVDLSISSVVSSQHSEADTSISSTQNRAKTGMKIISVHKVGDYPAHEMQALPWAGKMYSGSFVVRNLDPDPGSSSGMMSMVVRSHLGAIVLEITEKAEEILKANQDAETQYEICVLRRNCKLKEIVNNEKATFWFRTFLKNQQKTQARGGALQDALQMASVDTTPDAEEKEETPSRDSLVNDLDFLLETKKWKASVVEQSEAGKIMANLVFQTYLSAQSSRRVVLKAGLRESIEREVLDLLSTPLSSIEDPQMFNEAFKEVFTRLETGPFVKFVDSWEFNELLESFSSERW
eukprot:CAMPEP_0117762554 /NCGR_PEP_ID=MMETSP0947-20121206/18011_1 /TAXON_ID=44440 /ORGANISM="Chattonella subsalsa, Strain CCMP2191" /LENGTH=805 /DNA_ID=CAMNT_0005583891 /DNA_START=24 /DNA_END=2438 /DNA_ORIENTATION=+